MVHTILKTAIATLLALCLLGTWETGAVAEELTTRDVEDRERLLSTVVALLDSMVRKLVEERKGQKHASLNEASEPAESRNWTETSEEPEWSAGPEEMMAGVEANFDPSKETALNMTDPEATAEGKSDMGVAAGMAMSQAAEASPEAMQPATPYELTVIEPGSGKTDSLIIALHGLNGTVSNMMPFINAVRLGAFENTKFILPQAPTQFVFAVNQTIPSWYDILGFKLDSPEVKDEILEAAQNIANIIDREQRLNGIAAHRIAVIGFSQGGGVALTTYLRHQVGAVVGLATYLPLRNTYPEGMTDLSANSPALMLHGTEDEVIPFSFGAKSADILKGLGREVRFVGLAGGRHSFISSIPMVVMEIFVFLEGSILNNQTA